MGGVECDKDKEKGTVLRKQHFQRMSDFNNLDEKQITR